MPRGARQPRASALQNRLHNLSSAPPNQVSIAGSRLALSLTRKPMDCASNRGCEWLRCGATRRKREPNTPLAQHKSLVAATPRPRAARSNDTLFNIAAIRIQLRLSVCSTRAARACVDTQMFLAARASHCSRRARSATALLTLRAEGHPHHDSCPRPWQSNANGLGRICRHCGRS